MLFGYFTLSIISTREDHNTESQQIESIRVHVLYLLKFLHNIDMLSLSLSLSLSVTYTHTHTNTPNILSLHPPRPPPPPPPNLFQGKQFIIQCLQNEVTYLTFSQDSYPSTGNAAREVPCVLFPQFRCPSGGGVCAAQPRKG